MPSTAEHPDPRFPRREDSTVPGLLERRAAEHPERTYAIFDDLGETWTYGDAWDRARATAAALAELGVQRGEHVLVWLPNGPDVLRSWFGANLLGAVYVPINLSYRGGLLEHVIANSGARTMIADASLVERLVGADTAQLAQVVVLGGEVPAAAGVAPRLLPASALEAEPAAFQAPQPPVEPWETQCVIYTSGTTGPSKGVLCSHLHQHATVMSVVGRFGPEERSLIALPLFHAAATQDALGTLTIGASFVVVPRFRTEEFWEVVRRTGITCCTVLGAMARFLLSQPPERADAENPLRTVFMVPLTEDAAAFGKRFGVDVYTVFNMTEISCPLVSEPNPTAVGSCGVPRPGVEVRIVDEYDREVAVGAVGELIVRTDLPWAMMHGYHRMPEATARAWRNGWFHTGDAFRRDAEGNWFFVDRMKDAIRRRGENISSFEVEAELLAHPAVREAAVVAAPSELSEDEVLAIVAPVEGCQIDPRELVEFLIPRMAHFMVPRYVRVLPALPRTPTEKVEKYRLRAEGVTADTWDRQGAGVEITRTTLAG